MAECGVPERMEIIMQILVFLAINCLKKLIKLSIK